MLGEWLEKEASNEMAKTASDQFEAELAALDKMSVLEVYKEAKEKVARLKGTSAMGSIGGPPKALEKVRAAWKKGGESAAAIKAARKPSMKKSAAVDHLRMALMKKAMTGEEEARIFQREMARLKAKGLKTSPGFEAGAKKWVGARTGAKPKTNVAAQMFRALGKTAMAEELEKAAVGKGVNWFGKLLGKGKTRGGRIARQAELAPAAAPRASVAPPVPAAVTPAPKAAPTDPRVARHTPGTPEYQARQAKMQQEGAARRASIHRESRRDFGDIRARREAAAARQVAANPLPQHGRVIRMD